MDSLFKEIFAPSTYNVPVMFASPRILSKFCGLPVPIPTLSLFESTKSVFASALKFPPTLRLFDTSTSTTHNFVILFTKLPKKPKKPLSVVETL